MKSIKCDLCGADCDGFNGVILWGRNPTFTLEVKLKGGLVTADIQDLCGDCLKKTAAELLKKEGC